MTNFDLPQEFKAILTLENQCNSVRLLNIMMIYTEAEKISSKIQQPVKINISKRPKKLCILFNGETLNISFWDWGKTRKSLLFLFHVMLQVLASAERQKKNKKQKN